MMAFALYCLLDKKYCDDKGADVRRLAASLHRTPDAVALKIWNIAAHDANRRELGRVGMRHGSKLDMQIWEWFAERGDDFLFDCVSLLDDALAKSPLDIEGHFITDRVSSVERFTTQLGRETKAVVKKRLGQTYFRNTLLLNYKGVCCLTGLAIPNMLVASHIKPWADSTPTEKTAAANGLLLNALHDRAFDQGLITIDHDYRIQVAHDGVRDLMSRMTSPDMDADDIEAIKAAANSANERMLYAYEGHAIHMPRSNPPSHEFIDWHHRHVWLGQAV